MHRVQYLAGSIGACLITRTLHPSAPVHPVTSTINGPVRAAMEFLMRSSRSHMHPTSNVRNPAEHPTAAVADAPATNPALSSGAKAISVTVTHRVTPPPAAWPAPATAPSRRGSPGCRDVRRSCHRASWWSSGSSCVSTTQPYPALPR